jgi:NADH-quinone oxidoreductase subunit L
LFDTKIVKAIASSTVGKTLTKLWFAAWGFDWLYDKVFVKPYVFISYILRKDPIDKLFNLIPSTVVLLHKLLSSTQNGSVRWYAASIAAGVVIILASLILL